nr:hypothetical protein [Paenibacillus prosopidis]
MFILALLTYISINNKRK